MCVGIWPLGGWVVLYGVRWYSGDYMYVRGCVVGSLWLSCMMVVKFDVLWLPCTPRGWPLWQSCDMWGVLVQSPSISMILQGKMSQRYVIVVLELYCMSFIGHIGGRKSEGG